MFVYAYTCTCTHTFLVCYKQFICPVICQSPTLKSGVPPHRYPFLSTMATAFPSTDTAISVQYNGVSFLIVTVCYVEII